MPYREKELRNLAVRRDYTYGETDEHGLSQRLREFRLNSRGHSRTVTNVLRRQHGMLEYDSSVFDFSYREWGDEASKATHQTVFFLESQQLVLPELRMQPETVVHKLGELFGFGDIDFVRFPKFSSQYRLTGEDEVFIRHHFTDEVLSFFTLNKGWSLEAIGYYVILYKKGFLLPPDQIDALFRKGMRVYELFREQPSASGA